MITVMLRRLSAQRHRRDSRRPPACHPFFAHLSDNFRQALAPTNAHQLPAVVPWIMTEHMLLQWSAANPGCPPIEPSFSLTSLTAILRARPGDFARPGPGDTCTKQVSELKLRCSAQPFFRAQSETAVAKLLGDICRDWAATCRLGRSESSLHAEAPGQLVNHLIILIIELINLLFNGFQGGCLMAVNMCLNLRS